MATYSVIRITTGATTAVSETSPAGITTVSSVPISTTYDLIRVLVDDTNDIISGYKADNTFVVFEAAATLSIAFIA